MRFLDTNVLLRHLVDDNPEQSHWATELLLRIESGEESVQTTQSVIFETIFTLYSFYKLSLDDVRDRIIPLIQLPGIYLEQKDYFEPALDIAIEKNIDFQDAFNAVFMQEHGLREVYSWDRHFDRIERITRVEPGTPSQG